MPIQPKAGSPLGPAMCSIQENSEKIRVHQQPQCQNQGLNSNFDLYSSRQVNQLIRNG